MQFRLMMLQGTTCCVETLKNCAVENGVSNRLWPDLVGFEALDMVL